MQRLEISSNKATTKMGLALNFLLIILIELPIIALFFKRKKRQTAVLMGLLINIISWSVAHVIFFSTDINMIYVAVGLAIGEAIAFHQLLECNWTKAIILSLIVNTLSFFATQFIPGDLDIFRSKPEVIQRVEIYTGLKPANKCYAGRTCDNSYLICKKS